MTQPCMSCARVGTSCCKNNQVNLTTGDIQRVSDFLGHQNFYTLEPPVLEEICPAYDPQWLPLIMEPTGKVRVLKRTAEKNCSMLTENGCQLPYDCRPLICRLYPYTYTEEGIMGIDASCPISREKNWSVILEQLDMPADKARQWLGLLYTEVKKSHEPCEVSPPQVCSLPPSIFGT
ncbi:YkgJ family cysteine cluster protein [Desulfocicer niacini]